MKRLLSAFLCVCLLLCLTACGEKALDPAEASKLVIWHDKEDAVVAALEDYLAAAVPELQIAFEKEYIETALYLILVPNTGLLFVYCSIYCGFVRASEPAHCGLSLICRLNLQANTNRYLPILYGT